MSKAPPPKPIAKSPVAGPRPQPTITSSILQINDRIYHTLFASNIAFPSHLSWILTIQIFAISAMWWMATLPIRVGINIYDRHIRAIFPTLPSIRELLLTVRTAVLASFKSLAPGPGKSSASGRPQGRRGLNGQPGQLGTLDVNLNSLPGSS